MLCLYLEHSMSIQKMPCGSPRGLSERYSWMPFQKMTCCILWRDGYDKVSHVLKVKCTSLENLYKRLTTHALQSTRIKSSDFSKYTSPSCFLTARVSGIAWRRISSRILASLATWSGPHLSTSSRRSWEILLGASSAFILCCE